MSILYLRLLTAILWLMEQIWNIIPDYPETNRFIFYRVRNNKDGTYSQGDIMSEKVEVGFNYDVDAVADAPFEVGSEQWDLTAIDLSGNDISDEFSLSTQAPTGENAGNPQALSARVVQNNGTSEGTVTVRLQADGDPDVGEEAPLIGTIVFDVDARNATTFTLSAKPHLDETEPAPVPEPIPGTDEEPV